MAIRTEATVIHMKDAGGTIFEVQQVIDFSPGGLVGGPANERPTPPIFRLDGQQVHIRPTGEFVHPISGKLMRKV